VEMKWVELRQWGPMAGTPSTPERDVADRDMEGSVVAMLNFHPCAWMFGILHPRDTDNHSFDCLCLSISLWVEGN
jgi:hypothetical protein